MSARTVEITSPMWWSVQALPFIYQSPCDDHPRGAGPDRPAGSVNLWWGCTPYGPGCHNCYAEELGKRFGVSWGKGSPRRIISDKTVRATLRKLRRRATDGEWSRRPRVFAQSLSDTFDAEMPAEQRERLWSLIREHTWCDWLVLTKRAELLRELTPPDAASWEHVWWIVSAADQQRVNERVPFLLGFDTAGQRGISLEPLVGPVRFGPFFQQEPPITDTVLVGCGCLPLDETPLAACPFALEVKGDDSPCACCDDCRKACGADV